MPVLPLTLVRMVTIGLLCMLAVFVLWRGLRLGWLTWQGVEAVQQLQADSSGQRVRVGSGRVRRPNGCRSCRHDLQALSERLGALDAELQPLAPAARALAGLPGYGCTIAGGAGVSGVRQPPGGYGGSDGAAVGMAPRGRCAAHLFAAGAEQP